MSKPHSNGGKLLSELSDAELRYAELEITDPYAQDGLITEKPDDFDAIRDTLEIVNTYSYERYPIEKVKCIDCNSARHGEGCTLQAPDGRKFLLGSECGPRLLGRNYADLKKVYGRYKDKKHHLNWLEDVGPRLLRAIQPLYAWEETAKTLRDGRRQFKSAMPTLFELLTQHDRGDGVLYEHRKIVRNEEELQRGQSRIEYIAVGIHRAIGLKYLTDADPVERVVTARKELIAVSKEATGRRFLKVQQLVRLKRQFDTAVRRLEAVVQHYDQAIEFHRADNLRGIAAWWKLTRGDAIEPNDETEELLRSGKSSSIKLDDSLKELDRSLLSILGADRLARVRQRSRLRR